MPNYFRTKLCTSAEDAGLQPLERLRQLLIQGGCLHLIVTSTCSYDAATGGTASLITEYASFVSGAGGEKRGRYEESQTSLPAHQELEQQQIPHPRMEIAAPVSSHVSQQQIQQQQWPQQQLQHQHHQLIYHPQHAVHQLPQQPPVSCNQSWQQPPPHHIQHMQYQQLLRSPFAVNSDYMPTPVPICRWVFSIFLSGKWFNKNS
jgi:hypothetical protein